MGYPADHRLWVEIIAESSRNDEVNKVFIATDMVMRDGIKSNIRNGIEKRDFPANLNINEATIAIYAIIDGLISRKAINSDFDIDKHFTSLDAILRAILRA